MPHAHKFHFCATASGSTLSEMIAASRRLEDMGYSTVHLGDHFFFPFAAIPLLTAIAAATSTLRLQTMLDNNVRHPSVVAKELATLDQLSRGRLDVGIGAGAFPAEHVRFIGIPAAPLKTRLERLDEALDVFEGLWGDGAFNHSGTHYRIDGLEGLPKPAQRPRPPIWIGGFGKGIMSLAGRRADIVNPLIQRPPRYEAITTPSADVTNTLQTKGGQEAAVVQPTAEDNLRERLGWIRDAAGDRFRNIEIQLIAWTACITADREQVARSVAGGPLGMSADEVLAAPNALIGTTEQIVDMLQERRERFGVSYWNIFGSDEQVAAFAPVVQRLSGS